MSYNSIQACYKCGRTVNLALHNNPIIGQSICYSCLNKSLSYNNIEHGEFYCRTYNLPWYPDVWVKFSEEYKEDTFKEYADAVLAEKENQPNLAYNSSTKDLWSKTNKEWEKCRSFNEILLKIKPIQESYLDRGHLKWGEQYSLEQIINLDSVYSRTLKANQITNPLQKEAVKTLCKLQIEIDEAIRLKDAKSMKDLSTAWSTFAKQADLENMINETKTQDITTVAELVDYMERKGYNFKFYDGATRDEVDSAIKDIQESNRRLILEATGLQSLLEEMIRKQQEQTESDYAAEITSQQSLADMLNFNVDDTTIDEEDDADVENASFDGEE